MAVRTQTKWCGGCERELPVEAFARDRRRTDGRQAQCRECKAAWRERNSDREAGYKLRHIQRFPERRQEYMRRYAQQVRDRVFAAYGPQCACCGEDRREFLTLDHIGGRTGEHVGATTVQVHLLVLREGCPRDRYRVLCWNCNMAHGMYGFCPHERELKAVI